MPKLLETNGIVVGYTDYRESDRIVRLITSEFGLLSVLARSARSSKNKMVGTIDLGNHLNVAIRSSNNDIWYLNSATLIDGHLNIRDDLYKLALMTYCCEITSKFSTAEAEAEKLFGLLKNTLGLLNQKKPIFGRQFRIGFEMKSLAFSGFLPTLSYCVNCGLASDSSMVYSLSEGGAAHVDCSQEAEIIAPLEWLKGLDTCLRRPLHDSISSQPINGPIWAIARQIEYHIESNLRSRSFLASLETGC